MHILGNFGPGGAEMGVVRLVKALSKGDFTHSVCSIGPNVTMKELLPKGVKCHSLGIKGSSYTVFYALIKLLKSTGTTIAHVNNLAPWFDVAFASKLAGCACIETFHGIEDDIERFSAPRRLLLRTAASMTRSLTAVAETTANRLNKLTRITRTKIRVIPNGVDTESFKPISSWQEKTGLRRALNLPISAILFGCVAALRPVKDHEGLLKTLQKALSGRHENRSPEIYLLLIGDGILRGQLEVLCENLGIKRHVIFLGRRNDIQKILQALDVFVLNSKTEGMSYAVLEAMASGLPVIATAVGANTELIDHGKEGYLIPQGDINCMTQDIARIISDTSLIKTMGISARKKIVENYSLEKMISAYQELYKGTLEEA